MLFDLQTLQAKAKGLIAKASEATDKLATTVATKCSEVSGKTITGDDVKKAAACVGVGVLAIAAMAALSEGQTFAALTDEQTSAEPTVPWTKSRSGCIEDDIAKGCADIGFSVTCTDSEGNWVMPPY